MLRITHGISSLLIGVVSINQILLSDSAIHNDHLKMLIIMGSGDPNCSDLSGGYSTSLTTLWNQVRIQPTKLVRMYVKGRDPVVHNFYTGM